MKKSLLIAASFLALGALLTSPLYAMYEEENASNPRRVIERLKEDATFEDYCP